MSAETQTRRITFNSQLKSDEQLFKTMKKVLTHLGDNIVGHTFDSLWEFVSSKPVDYYARHFRRENKRTNPLSSIKRPRTAYTFFTSERRNAIKASNPDKSFGDISKMVAAEWRKLSDKKRAAYVKREDADKQRYEAAKAELLASGSTAEPVEAPVAEEPVSQEASPPAKKSTKAKSKGGKRAARKQK